MYRYKSYLQIKIWILIKFHILSGNWIVSTIYSYECSLAHMCMPTLWTITSIFLNTSTRSLWDSKRKVARELTASAYGIRYTVFQLNFNFIYDSITSSSFVTFKSGNLCTTREEQLLCNRWKKKNTENLSLSHSHTFAYVWVRKKLRI